METLSEYGIIIKHVQQSFLIMPDLSTYEITPPTKKEKVLRVLEIIGWVFLTLGGVALTAVAVWGMIKYPPLIIFLVLGILFGAINNK